jgi:exodeoxyribonuclease V alpha subunit
MADPIPQAYFLRELFPNAGPDLLRLLDSAVENAALLRSDYHTIHDWLEIAGYPGAEGLHALLLVLLLALEEGSLCVELCPAALARRLADLVEPAEADKWATRILADLAGDAFANLIGTHPTDHRPVIRHTVAGKSFVYFQKYLTAELDFHARFTNRLARLKPGRPADGLAGVLREVLVEQPLRAAGKPIRLDREQRLAVALGLVRDLAIISGGPGTGKTSIVLSLLRCLVRCGHAPERIALAAPTGRAAQRLSDSLRAGLAQLPSADDAGSPDQRLRGVSATTLHQLLGYRPSRNLFGRHAENPIPADVVVVDEVSMVGLVLMSQLLQALAPSTKLILLGDKDQLPSVEAGAVLAALVPDGQCTAFGPGLCDELRPLLDDTELSPAEAGGPLRDCVVLLQTNHRSQPQIREAARAINAQDPGVVDRLPPLVFPADGTLADRWRDLERDGGCWLLEPAYGTAAELRGLLQHWAEHAYLGTRVAGRTLAELARDTELAEADEDGGAAQDLFRRLFELLDRYRLLTLLRDGAWGCVEINRFLDQLLRPRLDPDATGELFAGAPVLVTRNDPARQLHNGDVGLALRYRGGLRVVFPRQGRFASLPAESLPAHEPGFALTVHKSQGSEYAHVMVVLPPEGGRRLLTKELVYTAITRAKSLAVVCGTKDVLRLAITRRVVREAGMLGTLSIRSPEGAQ